MTFKQKQFLDFIKKFIGEFGYSPSYDEIKDELGLKSKSNINSLIIALDRQGYLKLHHGRARGIELVQQDNWQQIGKLAQKVVKSVGIEHINDNGEGTVEVDAKAFGELDIAISENKTL